jgi:hypothetical protein
MKSGEPSGPDKPGPDKVFLKPVTITVPTEVIQIIQRWTEAGLSGETLCAKLRETFQGWARTGYPDEALGAEQRDEQILRRWVGKRGYELTPPEVERLILPAWLPSLENAARELLRDHPEAEFAERLRQTRFARLLTSARGRELSEKEIDGILSSVTAPPDIFATLKATPSKRSNQAEVIAVIRSLLDEDCPTEDLQTETVRRCEARGAPCRKYEPDYFRKLVYRARRLPPSGNKAQGLDK